MQSITHPDSTYTIATGHSGRERLRILFEVTRDSTSEFLDQIGIQEQARCLDLGCGGGDVTLELARRVPAGSVIGLDCDPVVIHIARKEYVATDLDNIDYRIADATALAIDERFDLIYVRFLLSHLSDPTRLLQELQGLLNPGGILAIEDTDIAGAICCPPSTSFERASALYAELVHHRGGDSQLGLKIPALLRELKLSDIRIRIAQPTALQGPAKTIQALTLAAIETGLVAAGLATSDEIAVLGAELNELIERPDTLISTARIIQTTARKPG